MKVRYAALVTLAVAVALNGPLRQPAPPRQKQRVAINMKIPPKKRRSCSPRLQAGTLKERHEVGSPR